MVWYNGTRCSDRRQFNPGRFQRIILNDDQLKELYHNGTPIKEISSFFNCSIPTIKRHLRFLIPDKLRRYTFYYSQVNPINQRIIQLYTNHHYSTMKVGEIVGLNDETVRRRLQRLGIKLRGMSFKNLELFHPMQLNRRMGKIYLINDLNQFNQKFLEYYCLMYSHKKIAELLQIDRSTVSRRIKFLKTQYHFKSRFCRKCDNLFRFKVTEYIKNSRVCIRCRKDNFKL